MKKMLVNSRKSSGQGQACIPSKVQDVHVCVGVCGVPWLREGVLTFSEAHKERTLSADSEVMSL